MTPLRRRRQAPPRAHQCAVVAVDAAPRIVEALAGGLSSPPVVAVDLSRPVDEVLAAVRALDDDDDCTPVVLVHEASHAASVAAARARALAPPGAVLAVPVDLPPLARGCAAVVLARLAEWVPAATLLASVAADAAGELHVVARLGSVAKLRHPAPSMAQHARSYLPGNAFLVTLQPQATVSAWSAGALRSLPTAPAGAVVVVSSAGDDRATTELRAQLAADAIVDVAADPSSAEWWGARPTVEAVAVPGGSAALERLATAAVAGAFACRWCHRPTRASTCPACGMLHTDDHARLP